MSASRRDFQSTFYVFLSFDLTKICGSRARNGFRFDIGMRLDGLLVGLMQIQITQ